MQSRQRETIIHTMWIVTRKKVHFALCKFVQIGLRTVLNLTPGADKPEQTVLSLPGVGSMFFPPSQHST